MKQDVNLYQPLSGASGLMTSVALARLSAVAAVLLVLTQAAVWGWTRRIEARDAALVEQRETLSQKVEAAGAAAAPRPHSALLQAQLEKLKTEHAQKEAALQLLASGQLGNSEGFSPYFEALAREHLGGLWLTRVRFDAGGREVQLAGATVDEALLPRYLRQLADETVFRGTQFQSAALTRADGGAQLQFELRSGSGAP